MALILKRTIMTDTLSLIEQMCKNLPLQGNFWLSARKAPFSSEYELYLDLTTLSMHRFQALLALISAQLNSSKKGKPTNLLELAKAKACEMIDGLLRVNLLDFQDQQKLAEYQVSLKSWYNPSTDSALSALMADDVQSKQVCARAWQHLTSQKGQQIRRLQIQNFLESHHAGPTNSIEFMTYQEFVHRVGKIFEDQVMYVTLLRAWLEPERMFLMGIPFEDL